MTDKSAGFVLGFSFVQLALARAAAATISGPDAAARDLHCLQARQMLTYLQLHIGLTEMPAGDLAQMRQQADVIFLVLQARSKTAAWSFRLGCDLGALGTAQYQVIRSEHVEPFSDKFDEECRESGVPFDLIRDVLWASADTSLSRSGFVECVSKAMNRIAEHLEGPGLQTMESVQ